MILFHFPAGFQQSLHRITHRLADFEVGRRISLVGITAAGGYVTTHRAGVDADHVFCKIGLLLWIADSHLRVEHLLLVGVHRTTAFGEGSDHHR